MLFDEEMLILFFIFLSPSKKKNQSLGEPTTNVHVSLKVPKIWYTFIKK